MCVWEGGGGGTPGWCWFGLQQARRWHSMGPRDSSCSPVPGLVCEYICAMRSHVLHHLLLPATACLPACCCLLLPAPLPKLPSPPFPPRPWRWRGRGGVIRHPVHTYYAIQFLVWAGSPISEAGRHEPLTTKHYPPPESVAPTLRQCDDPMPRDHTV